MNPIKKQFIGLSWTEIIFFLLMVIYATAICWSNYLTSASIILMSCLILFTKKPSSSLPFNINSNIIDHLNLLKKEYFLCSMILVFLAVFLSGLWSEEYSDWYGYSRMKSPFLFLPILFIIYGNVEKKFIYFILLMSLIAIGFNSIFVLINYFGNYTEYNLNLLKGKPILTPISHIRYSLIIACSALILLHWIIEKWKFNFTWERAVYIILFLYFILCIHILSVKTGLLSLYVGILVYLSIYCLKYKLLKTYLSALGLMALGIFLAFYFIPSLQQKYYYTLWQIGEFQRGKWIEYSDIERLLSIQLGFEIVKHYPILGSGMGDIKEITKQTYLECLNHPDYRLPHNQYIFSWAYCGILGFFSIIAMSLSGLFSQRAYKSPIIFSLQVALWISFLFEATLETELGTCIYLFYSLCGWMILKESKHSH
ncbi:MAG: O-antigen ligase family protein [Bacteroidota bacterium]|nr:O-antigen ligase family protein [Bacteroidota bacterium]